MEACELEKVTGNEEEEDWLEDREPKRLPSPEDCEELEDLIDEELELFAAEY